MAKLGEICEKKIDTINSNYTGIINYIDISSVDNQKKTITDTQRISFENAPSRAKQLVIPGDILVSTVRPNLNAVALVTEATDNVLIASTGYCVLRCLPSVDNKYVFYFCQSSTFVDKLVGQATGASYPAVTSSIVRECSIHLPDLEEQRHIATVLDKVTDLIAKRRAQLDKLDLLVKSRFVEMFGTEREFGRWPCGKVGDIADVCVGVVIKPTQYYAEEGVKAFRSLNIGPMYVKDNDWVYFSQEGHLKNQKSVIHKGDVLIVRSGVPGIACVATEEYDGCNAVDIIIARPNTNMIDPVFLAMFTNLPHGMNQIRERTGGAAQQHFNVGGYKALTLIMPPLDIQKQFAHFFEQTSKIKLAIQQSLDKLEMLKKAFLQKYFA